MQERIPYNTVVLVRARPGSSSQACARLVVERSVGSCLVFFHGRAVAVSTRDAEDWCALGSKLGNRSVKLTKLALRVCSAAWQRHGSGRLPSGFEVASLTGFWHAASHADRLISIGYDDIGYDDKS